MFTRTIFVIGFFVVGAVIALGALASGGDGPEGAGQGDPPASALDEAAVTVEAPATATPEPPPPTNTPRPKPTETSAPTESPRATETPPPSATPEPARVQGDFGGTWTVQYTITEGLGAGESYAFDVSLEQNGRSLRGGNDGVVVTGIVDGQTATLTYRQPALGYTATFTLTLVDGNWGGGAFTSAVNSGTSRVQRVQ